MISAGCNALIARIAIALVLLGAPSRLSAQDPRTTRWDSVSTPHGRCRLWGFVPGGSNPGDQGLSVCSLQRRPVPLDGNTYPELEPVSTGVRGTFTVVIDPDGTVDPRFTRYWSYGWTGPRSRAITDSARLILTGWRFSPGMRSDTAVRVALDLELNVPAAPDSQPATLAWRYVQGIATDSLVGTWTLSPPLPPFDESAVLDATALAVRGIVRTETRELLPGFCLRKAAPQAPAIADLRRRLLRTRSRHERSFTECKGQRRGIELHIGKTWRPAPDVATVQIDIINETRQHGLHYRCLVTMGSGVVECDERSFSVWVY